MIARWLTVNIITVLMIIVWSIFQGFDSIFILTGKVFSQFAFILFLINVNMYFVFLLIRKSKVRNVKIKLAQISKRMMKYHIPIAVTATILVLIHGLMMFSSHPWSIKIQSGLLAIVVLNVLLFSGLLRRKKATGRRRRFHFRMAFLFFAFILVHIFI